MVNADGRMMTPDDVFVGEPPAQADDFPEKLNSIAMREFLMRAGMEVR
jgi:hypothetical protein